MAAHRTKSTKDWRPDDVLRCPCGYEGKFFQVAAHRGHSKNPDCKTGEPVLVSRGVIDRELWKRAGAADAPPEPVAEAPSFTPDPPSPGTGLDAMFVEVPPPPPPPPVNGNGHGAGLDPPPPPPPPLRHALDAGGRMEVGPAPGPMGQPPLNTVTIRVSARSQNWYDFCQQRGFDGSFDRFVDECIAGRMKMAGFEQVVRRIDPAYEETVL